MCMQARQTIRQSINGWANWQPIEAQRGVYVTWPSAGQKCADKHSELNWNQYKLQSNSSAGGTPLSLPPLPPSSLLCSCAIHVSHNILRQAPPSPHLPGVCPACRTINVSAYAFVCEPHTHTCSSVWLPCCVPRRQKFMITLQAAEEEQAKAKAEAEAEAGPGRARSRRQHLSNFQSGLQTMQQQQLQQQLVAKNIGSRGGITNYCWDTPLKCFPAASLQRLARLVYTHHDALLMPCELQNTNRFKPRSSRAGARCCWHCSSMSSEGRFISHLWWSSPENANKTGIMNMM